MQLTILCDNSVSARPGLIGEHGFSCHIENNGHQYLFDTGNGLGLINNAKTCGIDLNEIDAILLSHGHWDHCGGLLELLKARKGRRTPVYAHPALFDEKISISNGIERATGAGFSQDEAEAAGAVFHLSVKPVELPGGLIFSGEIPRSQPTEPENGRLHRKAGQLIPDPLLDDQSLYLQSDSGLIILCGCAHAGVQNILEHAINLTNSYKLHALIGGLHLLDKGENDNSSIINELQKHDIQLLATSHCTGRKAITQLINTFGPIVQQGEVGSRFSFQDAKKG